MPMHDPAHPGRILAHYMSGRSVTEVAQHLGVTRPALSRVLNGRRPFPPTWPCACPRHSRPTPIFGSVCKFSAISG
jgi:hypothetical protein